MWKKLQLIPLPTDKLDKGRILAQSVKREWRELIYPLTPEVTDPYWKPYHLYLTSEDEIKEGDWIMSLTFFNLIAKVKSKYGEEFDAIDLKGVQHGLATYDGCRKIVATTNPDLTVTIPKGADYEKVISLPKIPQSLIEYFVKRQGNVKEMMVKYERQYGEVIAGVGTGSFKGIFLKLTPSGKIIWKPVEEKMYTREELIEIVHNYVAGNYPNYKGMRQVIHWLDESYPQ